MVNFVNISTYKFAPLGDLKSLRTKLKTRCKEWEIKGTILISTEGINLFVAGRQKNIERLLATFRRIPGLEDLEPKKSESSHQPFRRMLVRVKKEIIAFGVEGIDPAKHTVPKISPRELKTWLDEGRKLTLLDTRNDFEIKLGTFENALSIGVKHFREFPKAVSSLPNHLRETPIVMFCTGGIRCEKAGPYMESQGFRNVVQLDGGILKYFEECGSTHYQGNCFVFDQRVGVDPALHETEDAQCFACLTPLTSEEQRDQRYERGVSCPFCFKTSEQRMQLSIAERHQRLARETNPLPGSEPYHQKRPLKIPASYEGARLIEFLLGVFKHVPLAHWERELAALRILGPDHLPVKAEKKVSAGERYFSLTPNQSEPPVNADVRILYEDEAMIILEKPAPLPVHSCGRYHRNTLQSFLAKVYAPQRPHIAHRLDANTTGLVVVARTRYFSGLLQPQFSRGEVEKLYLARVQGHPLEDTFVCELPVTDEMGETGVRRVDADGLSTRTEFEVIRRFVDGTSLLKVRPRTGRTNQIRIHLWELGWPICGDQRYLPQRKLGKFQTGDVADAPLCLHAKRIDFKHPVSGDRMSFEASDVDWLAERFTVQARSNQ
jgi:UPF0176 protein